MGGINPGVGYDCIAHCGFAPRFLILRQAQGERAEVGLRDSRQGKPVRCPRSALAHWTLAARRGPTNACCTPVPGERRCGMVFLAQFAYNILCLPS